MTNDDIQRGLALCEAATPGPWYLDTGNRLRGAVSTLIDGVRRQVAMIDGQAAQFDMRNDNPAVTIDANAAFIAEARTLLPAALREVQRLRGELEQARAERDKLRGLVGEALGEAREGYSRGWDGLDRRDATERLARIARDGGVE